MRPVTWLHVSDFHLREGRSSLQGAVLSAMLEDLSRRRGTGLSIDFILATGDLAFSGENSQYDLVATFFNRLASTIDLPTTRIFCVPGNHDVQRERRTICFAGARQTLQSHNDIYRFLADVEERNTLLTRQENFRRFQNDFFPTQVRQPTADDLGYVSSLDVADLRIAILALNSAWLSEGGTSDERHLLISEHQVTNAIEIASRTNPHILIAIQHHPFDFLCRFDQRTTQRRLQEACHFIHSGHLHEPDATEAVTYTGHCLTLAAGASFESRAFRNAYTLIHFDPLNSHTDVTFVQYEPTDGAFSYDSRRHYSHALNTALPCTSAALADAIQRCCPLASTVAHYLASLVCGEVSDVPIPINSTIVFGTIEYLRRQPDTGLTDATVRFLAIGRAIRFLHPQKSLDEILRDHANHLLTYTNRLTALCGTHPDFSEQLMTRDIAATTVAIPRGTNPFHHTLNLLDQLLAAGDWEALREVADRSCELPNPTVVVHAKRALGLCLARSTEQADRASATTIYRELTSSSQARSDDWAALATLLASDGNHDEAKAVVRAGIRAFPQQTVGFVDIGMRIVAATGDLAFRNELRNSQREEAQRDR